MTLAVKLLLEWEELHFSACVCVHVCDPIGGSYQLVVAGGGELSV